MPSDYRIPGYIDNWLSSWGFDGNPFASWEANLEPNLEQYYVKHPFYEQLLNTPKSTIVFAPRGGGKTATRLMVQSECRPAKKNSPFFAVPITDYSHLIEGYGIKHQYTMVEFIPLLLDRALVSLYRSIIILWQDGFQISDASIKELVYWTEMYAPQYLERDYLPALISKITPNATRERIRDLVYAFNDGSLTKQNPTKYWTALFSFWQHLKSAEGKKPSRLKYEKTATAIIDNFVEFALTTLSSKERPCHAMYFLFDGLDEYAVTKNDPWASAGLLGPLLSEMSFHRINRLANKFFLPLEQKNEISHVARLDLLETHDLVWHMPSSKDPFEALRRMLHERMLSFNKVNRTSLRDMCDPSVKGWIEDEMLERADNSPRNLVRLGYLLFFEHCRDDAQPRSKISKEEWYAAVRELRTSELYVPISTKTLDAGALGGQQAISSLIRVDLQSRRIYLDNDEINLAPLELDLLLYLYRHRGQLCTYNEIMEKLYGEIGDATYQNTAFRALLRRLRKKLATKNDWEYIRVVPKQGLILENSI